MIIPVGWFKTYRELWHKPMWTQSSPKRKVIIMTLLAMANFQERYCMWKGKKGHTQPGQFITSLEAIQIDCGKEITIRNVRSTISVLERKYHFLTNESTKEGRLITILNWEKFQGNDIDIDKVIDSWVTKERQTTDKEVTIVEERKKDKKERNNNYTASFEKFWEIYPKKVGKMAALRAFKQLKQVNDLLPAILAAITRQKQSEQWRKDNGQFIPNPATWLNQGRWEDEVDIPTEHKQEVWRAEDHPVDPKGVAFVEGLAGKTFKKG